MSNDFNIFETDNIHLLVEEEEITEQGRSDAKWLNENYPVGSTIFYANKWKSPPQKGIVTHAPVEDIGGWIIGINGHWLDVGRIRLLNDT